MATVQSAAETNSQVKVQIPGKAVSDKTDVQPPVRALLEDLYLLGSKEDTEKAGQFQAIFGGPPQSVALIEAGATAATKWWAAGLGAAAIALWVRVGAWWGTQPNSIKMVVIGGVAFLTAAIVVAIGYWSAPAFVDT